MTSVVPERAGLDSSRPDWIRMVLASVIIGLLYLLYWRIGTVWVNTAVQKAAIPWIEYRWRTGVNTYGLAYYILGWATPFISTWLVWRDRWGLLAARKRVNWLGFLLIGACLFAHWAGVKTEHLRLSALSLIGLTWSIPLFLFGWAVAKRLLFPCAFLVVCVPLNFLDGPVFRLRMITAKLTAAVLGGLGLPCVPRGTTLFSTQEGGFVLQFQAPPAGFGTLLVVGAAGALFAYIGHRGWWRRWLVFLGALPAFFLTNIVVMTGYGLLAATIGQGAVDRLGGKVLMVVLVVGTAVLLWGWGRLVEADWSACVDRWKVRLTQPAG